MINSTNSTAMQDRKYNAATRHVHSVEALVIESLSNAEKTRKEYELTQEIAVKQQYTRSLIKSLFSCKSQLEVDRVIVVAEKSSESFEYEWGTKVDFHARIRNAELQVRDLLGKGYDLSTINPDKTAFVVSSRDCSALVDSWGHLADRLMKGFVLKL